MAGPKVQIMHDILEEHFEELQSLWGQRQAAFGSLAYTSRELFDLEARIEAHVQGLLGGREQTIPLIEGGLLEDDSLLAFATSYVLLRLNSTTAARQVIDVFSQAEAEQLNGIRQALCHGPINMVRAQLREVVAMAQAPIAVAAAEALAFHYQLDPKAERLSEFLQDENVEVRQTAWRVVGIVDSTSALSSVSILDSSRPYEAGLRDVDPGVRHAAMKAAAWTQQKWLLEHCRRLSNDPLPEHWEAILFLAILGEPSDLERILVAGKTIGLGPQQFRALGAFGHPCVVEILLEGIKSTDPFTAAAAGVAFAKITGVDIESDTRVEVPPENGNEPDEFEQEFLDEVTLPSPEIAQDHWKNLREAFSQGSRWCRGFDLSHNATDEVLAQLDLESRWETCMRGKLDGSWQGSLIDLTVFPQKCGLERVT